MPTKAQADVPKIPDDDRSNRFLKVYHGGRWPYSYSAATAVARLTRAKTFSKRTVRNAKIVKRLGPQHRT